MIETDSVDRVEARQIVFVRRGVAGPRNDVERRVTRRCAEKFAAELADDFERTVTILERGGRIQKIAIVGQPVRTDRSAFGQLERCAIVFTDIAAGVPIREFDAELQTARYHRNFARHDAEQTAFRMQQQATVLRNDQQFTVRVIKEAVRHRLVGGVHVDAHTDMGPRIAVGGHRDEAVDEIRRPVRHRQWIPAQLIRNHDAVDERRRAHQ